MGGGAGISFALDRTADPSPPLRSGRDDKKERVVVGKGRLLEERAVGGGKGGLWRKGRLLEERAVVGGKGGWWRKGRLVEERAVAGGKGGWWRKGRLVEERAVAGGRGGC
jgi:hypothetical protein